MRQGIEIHSIPRGKVVNVHRVEYRDGTGDVVFGFEKLDDVCTIPQGFLGITDVRRVEEQVWRVLVEPRDQAAETRDRG